MENKYLAIFFAACIVLSSTGVWWYEESVVHTNDKKKIEAMQIGWDATNKTALNQSILISDFKTSPVYPLYEKWKQGKSVSAEVIRQVAWIVDQGQGAIDTLHWLYDNGGHALSAAQWVMGHKDQVDQAQGIAGAAQNLTSLVHW